ncbi:hypothetical protein ACXIUH_08920 [Vibrio parahaemolyticus]
MSYLKPLLSLSVVGLKSGTSKKPLRMPMMLLATWLMVAGCASQSSQPPSWPPNLNITLMSDGGVCFDKESASRLSDFKTQLEAW